MRHTRFGFPFLVVLIGTSAALPGCGAEAPPPVEVVAVDPRFESAEALVSYFNEINRMDPPDFEAEFALYHLENDLQRDLHQIARMMILQHQFETALTDRFGDEHTSSLSTYPETATMTEENGDRAVARAVGKGGKRELHLVRIGDRWWISGYTHEYDPDIDADEMPIEELKKIVAVLQAVVPTFAARVRAGTYATYEDAMESYVQMIADKAQTIR